MSSDTDTDTVTVNLSKAAKGMGVSRWTIYHWIASGYEPEYGHLTTLGHLKRWAPGGLPPTSSRCQESEAPSPGAATRSLTLTPLPLYYSEMSAELITAKPSGPTLKQEQASVVLTVHPLADKFPALPPDDFTKLKESLALRGQFEPIVANAANQILDGRHRYKACIELGIEPRIVNFSALQENSPGLTEEQFIYDSNIHRRHLTPDQRVQLEAIFLPFIKAETLAAKTDSLSKARKAKTKNSVDTKSCPQKRDTKAKHANSAVGKLAAKADVSHHQARHALEIEAVPDLADKVRNGEMTQKQANHKLAKRKSLLNATQEELPAVAAAEAEKPLLSLEAITNKTNDWWESRIEKFLDGFHPSQWHLVLGVIMDDCAATMEDLTSQQPS